MIKWYTHTEGVLPYVAHAVVYHHLWCGPAVASHQKSHAPVVCLGPRWWFYSSSTAMGWRLSCTLADSRQLPRVTGMTSSVGAALENFHVRKQEKNSGSTCARKKRSQKNITKNNSRHPQNWWFFSFGNGGQYPPVGVILQLIRATPKLVISSFDNGGLYPHVGVILRS